MKINRKKITIVDGYNVINAWPNLKDAIDDLEHSRDLLIDKLINYKHSTNEKIILVFDAHYVEGNKGTEVNMKGITVVYTKEKVNADSYIEKLVSRLAKDRRNIIKVVTFDYAEQQNVLGNGAIRITPLEFKNRIEDIEKRLELVYIKEKKRKEEQEKLNGNLDIETLKKLEKLKND
ncbi:MAG: NYN domain-containing protein [Bacillota bacterium]